MKSCRWFCFFLFLILLGCNSASVNGNLFVKVNPDGSGKYRFTILTHPIAIQHFQKYKAELIHNQFQIKEIVKDQQVGWIASKQVDNLMHEPPPISVPTTTNTPFKKAIHIQSGFYTTQIEVNYPLDLTRIVEEAPLIHLIKDRIHLNLVVSLPTAFQEHNASSISKDKKTATWKLKMDEINLIQAKVTFPNPVGWWITLIGISILFILIIMFVFKHKNKSQL